MCRIIHFFLTISLFIGIVACQQKPYPASLITVNELTYSRPDSALILLEQIKDEIITEPKHIQAYYQLLTIKARDKAYIEHTTDSMILPIVTYYEKRKDKEHLAEAYYYAGRVYDDLHDAPQALDYYQKAAFSLKDSKDYRLLKVIYSQMGKLFLYQSVYSEAQKTYKQAYHYSTLIDDKKGIIINLCDIGLSFMALHKADSALYYFEKAYQYAQLSENKKLISRTLNALADIYMQQGKADLALKIFQTFDTSQKEVIGNLVLGGDVYFQTGQVDSALFYYNRLLLNNDIYALYAGHRGLAKIAQQQSNYKEATRHLELYNLYSDSIKEITNTEAIYKVQSLYNYQLREQENEKLRVYATKQGRWVIICFFTVLLLTAIMLIYIQYNKRKKIQLKMQLEKLEYLKEEQYHKSNQFIEDNKRKIAELEAALQQSAQDNDNKQKLLAAQREQIIRLNSKVEADQKEQVLAETAFKQSDIYNKFHEAISNTSIKIETKDWEQLRTELDNCYKNFTLRLRAIYPISDMELKICMLLKTDISITGTAYLCARSKSAIVSARKKLYEKVFKETGKPEQWDEFILSF